MWVQAFATFLAIWLIPPVWAAGITSGWSEVDAETELLRLFENDIEYDIESVANEVEGDEDTPEAASREHGAEQGGVQGNPSRSVGKADGHIDKGTSADERGAPGNSRSGPPPPIDLFHDPDEIFDHGGDLVEAAAGGAGAAKREMEGEGTFHWAYAIFLRNDLNAKKWSEVSAAVKAGASAGFPWCVALLVSHERNGEFKRERLRELIRETDQSAEAYSKQQQGGTSSREGEGWQWPRLLDGEDRGALSRYMVRIFASRAWTFTTVARRFEEARGLAKDAAEQLGEPSARRFLTICLELGYMFIQTIEVGAAKRWLGRFFDSLPASPQDLTPHWKRFKAMAEQQRMMIGMAESVRGAQEGGRRRKKNKKNKKNKKKKKKENRKGQRERIPKRGRG